LNLTVHVVVKIDYRFRNIRNWNFRGVLWKKFYISFMFKFDFMEGVGEGFSLEGSKTHVEN